MRARKRSERLAAAAALAAAGLAATLLAGPAGAVRAPAAAGGGAAGGGIVAAPVRVARTSDGAVGYREIGRGSPVVLVMGFGGSMDAWAPSFVDALAVHHRVVIFDDAGVGKTVRPPGALTVAAMAGQTSALIVSLGLGRTAVLGWSMGGMIAQALAVLHPAQVSRLVLAATQPGTGRALPIPPAAAGEAASADPAMVLRVLFPNGAVAAARTYALGVFQYPDYYAAAAPTKVAQAAAVAGWLAGADAAGREPGRISVPTLVADGTVDALDPVANDRLLAASIAHAELALYAGAGHAFLFQDEQAFLARLAAFLA